MSDVNTDENFQVSFEVACSVHPTPVTFSHIFQMMEAGVNGYANPDFLHEKIQAGINDGKISVTYGVLDESGNVIDTFSGCDNQPEGIPNDRVEPVYSEVIPQVG